MAVNPQSTFDIGPLSWVKAEIEHSLTEARTHLDRLAADPGDAKSTKYVATHLHQVTGALSMVGLGAATRFNEEVEKLVETLENDPNARASAPQRIEVAKAATNTLSAYLDSLLAGEPDRPMMLVSAYLRANQARGASNAAESDLFSPDLSLALPLSEDTIVLPKSDMLADAIRQRRGMYQAGLLKLLRDKDLIGGAREMRNATLAVEALQAASPARSFWYATGGFFDAVAADPAEAGSLAVQLFGKIDQQIKLLIDGVQKVPERLFRDILLVIGRSKAQTERLKKIRELYRLDELLAVPEPTGASPGDDLVKTVIRSVRDQLQAQKELWLKISGGNRAAIEPYVAQAEALYRTAQQQPNRDLTHLLQALGAVGTHLRKLQIPASEEQALEVATALLFVEASLENYYRLTPDFSAQASAMVSRLKAAMTGAPLPAFAAGADVRMDDITKRAQERMLMFQVGQEVQVNLATIEGTLDAYFRDSLKTADLASLPPLFTQVQGALTMLELDEAAAINQVLRDRVAQFASGAVKGTGEAAEAVADGVSALGLYVTALQQGSASAREALLPALIRFGLAEKPADIASSDMAASVSAGDVDVAKQKVQARYADWKQQPEQTSSRDFLREAVRELRQGAELIADGESVRQSEEALKAIDATFDPHKTGITEALSEIAPVKPADAPTPQAVQLIDAPTTQIDQELLEIFLEEANEVIATVRENLARVRASTTDKDALTTIRRSYHTLKGSGRMVGLTDLGEVGWTCEQVMNKWLKDEKPATAGLISFIDRSQQAFQGWIDALNASGTTVVDGAELARIAELLKNDQEPDYAAAITAPAVQATPSTEAPVTGAPPDLQDFFAELPATVTAPPLVPPPEIATAIAAEAPAEPAEPEDIRVGSIRVPHALFNIYLGEADQHIATLDNEMSTLEARPLQPVTHEFMRAAHTLTSSSRTTTFEMIADVAFALEKWLQDAIEFTPAFDAHRLAVTRSAVDALSSMVMGLHTREAPMPRPDVVNELHQLRDVLRDYRRDGDVIRAAPPADDAIPAAPPVESADELAFFAEEPPPAVQIAAPPPEPAPVTGPAFDPALAFAATSAVAVAGAAAAFGAAPPTETPAVAVPEPAAELLPLPPAPAPASTSAQAGPVALESGKDRRSMADDVDDDLLPIFLEEAREIIPLAGNSLRGWRNQPANHAPVTELARLLHTLKGSARMAGLMRLGELAHVLEERVIRMDGLAEPAPDRFEEVDEGLDRFNAAINRLAIGDLAAAAIEIPALPDVSQGLPASIAVLAAARAEIAAEGEKLEGRERQSMLRVNADTIDRFVNEAGELSIARSRIDQEILTFKQSMVELVDNIGRMKTQLREIEIQAESQIQSRIKEAEEHGQNFDPLEFDRFSRTQELTRFLAESLNDVVTLQLSLQKNIDETEAALLQQSRLNRDLQQGLMGVRLVPLGNLQDRFYRLMRQTAKELDKKANLEFRGVRVEIDRSVLEKITAPIEHLLRNAVAHGIESPAERLAAGKPEIGEVSIDARQAGNEVLLTLADDGAGLDFKRIREKAIEKGLLNAGAEATEAQLTQFIFAPGFSTAREVTQIAGRGVGMDVVRNEIVSLGGRIDITSVAGRGTTFTIALPLTLAVTQAVMVMVGDHMYAIPSVMIEQVQEYKGKRYEPFLEMQEIEWKGNKYPLRSLEALLGGRPAVSAARKASVILAKSGQLRAAVQVDSIIGNREIVVKTIGPQLARLAGVAGATMTGSGQIVLIINPVQLVFRDATTVNVDAAPPSVAGPVLPPAGNAAPWTQANGAPGDAGGATAMEPASSGPAVPQAPQGQSLAAAIAASAPSDGGRAAAMALKRTVPLVMVVDDSLTVRKITSRMLLREGFEVVTAKDGVDGLQQLQDIEPDVILLDIEMPRMDGFEFARNVRADIRKQTREIPIVMITSRTADKHRSQALDIGVNEYMGKPYQEEQLLGLIRQYTGKKPVA
jgi:chemosensory pili system protein ChpA (sensor histidine kinase/response regulator)